MSALSRRLARFIRSRTLLVAGDRVVVALSGGPDSVALLHLLLECAPALGFTVSGVAHLHHGLRGEAADGDEAFCRALAERLGLPIHVERVDVSGLARSAGQSIESAGHHARAAFFERARTALGATRVATAHTANDVAETVLLHVSRGAGLRGLSGMRARAGAVVRPLLQVSRPEVEHYLAERSVPFREDATNRDLGIPRNRVRHEVLPRLDAAVPGVVGALGRLASIAADEDALLAAMARERAGALVRATTEGVLLDSRALAAEPPALRRRIVARAIERVGTDGVHRGIGLAHVEAVLALAAAGRSGASLSLPGRVAQIKGNDLWLVPAGSGTPAPSDRTPGVRQIPVPGVLTDKDAGWELTVELGAAMDVEAVRRHCVSRDRAVVDFAAAGSNLFVRYRRPGDRLRPLGMAGHRKLQDVFVDAKVAREQRDRVPLVVDAQDRIVWVAGHVIAAEARVSEGSTGVLLLGFRRLGGLG